jgi:hypothetical protein
VRAGPGSDGAEVVALEEVYHALSICDGGTRHPSLDDLQQRIENAGLTGKDADCAMCLGQEKLAKTCAGSNNIGADSIGSCENRCPENIFSIIKVVDSWMRDNGQNACNDMNTDCGL